MISAYALALASNFDNASGEIKQAIISRRHERNVKAIKTHVWHSYYQELVGVNIDEIIYNKEFT